MPLFLCRCGVSFLLLAPAKFRTVDPHAVHDHGEASHQGDDRLLGAAPARALPAPGLKPGEPRRVFRRLQLLRGWSHDEASSPVFSRGPCPRGSDGPASQGEHASQWAAIRLIAEKIGCSSETLRHWCRSQTLAVADGAFGFWKAVADHTRAALPGAQAANVLNKLPKSQQPKAKRSLQEIWMAETSKDAEAAFEAFITAYPVKYEGRRLPGEGSPSPARLLRFPRRALETPADLEPDREHLRPVRHRTIRSKGRLSNKTALAMVFKLVDAAQKSWRRLDRHNQSLTLIQGVRFTDRIKAAANPAPSKAQTAAA
jgi:hypothetical protein